MSRPALVVFGLVLVVGGCTTSHPPADLSPGPGSDAVSPMSSPMPGPNVERWVGRVVSITAHDLYVGGRCESDWRTTLTFRVREGRVRGSGTAIRTSTGHPCPFPVAQLQVRSFRLRVEGSLQAGRLDLRLRETGSRPSAGADDLGGFRATVLATALHLRVRGGAVSRRMELTSSDGDRGTYVSTNTVRLRCRSC